MDKYCHILLATDLHAVSEAVTARAAALAGRYQARLTVLHVLEHFPEDIPVDCIPPEDQDPKRFISERASSQLDALGARFGVPGDCLEILISSHSAKAEILRYADTHKVDLIVIGSHTHAGLGGVLGSTASGVVLAAPCDVLAVKL